MFTMTKPDLKAPCKNCEKRYVGCHSKCEAYIAFDAQCKKFREERALKGAEISFFTEQAQKQARRSGKYLRNVYY